MISRHPFIPNNTPATSVSTLISSPSKGNHMYFGKIEHVNIPCNLPSIIELIYFH